jgi:hypothetical protein
MSTVTRDQLRSETVDLFYHGYDNYMKHAFPEDELRPLSCAPLTRDRANPAHIELNDVLGNYSLTLIDSLSTLAILGSSSDNNISLEGLNKTATGPRALKDFQDGIQLLVHYYGDGTDGPGGQGIKARGFDLDSKVQVFETVIRGVGGLLSAHLFAVGELPINGYIPKWEDTKDKEGVSWPNGMIYNGQLLRLAKDLGQRLLPAFVSATSLPYPRVNLRTGVPFYANSPLNLNSATGLCPNDHSSKPEITETCSAGAGSLVLEFTTLSRLTGDGRFELAAKEAFWAVWKRRSAIGLIGAGIDAETGKWITPYTGIGAGIDSFFEYAFKSHILLSGLPFDHNNSATHSPDAFLDAWKQSHAAIRRHVYRGDAFHHPHYIQADLYTGAARAFWIDSLSAYYPGLLTLSGELEEATASHLLYTALWSRYAALPERWSTLSGDIEQGLRWWGGRPEFIESSWYLYRATKDPWYLHVGEMALKDIQRRCWTECGWAGLQDVQTGERTDRMESFFLGETAKYLYLLFDENHPLNLLDAPFVFTTEGHPLIIPRRKTQETALNLSWPFSSVDEQSKTQHSCPAPPPPVPFTMSATAARGDLFHAAVLARIEMLDGSASESTGEYGDSEPRMHPVYNSSLDFFPWSLPHEFIPSNGTCDKMMNGMTFDLSFPNYADTANPFMAVERVSEGVMLTSLSGVRLGMVRESDEYGESYRIYSVLNIAMGRDEKVLIGREVVAGFNAQDPYFTRVRDKHILDLLLDVSENESHTASTSQDESNDDIQQKISLDLPLNVKDSDETGSLFSSLIQNLQLILRDSMHARVDQKTPYLRRHILAGAMPTGAGVASFNTIDQDPLDLIDDSNDSPLIWRKIYISPHDMCTEILDSDIPRDYDVIVVPRGGCSFSTKLQHIPSFPPTPRSLQLVIVVSYPPLTNSRSREWALQSRDTASNTNNVRYSWSDKSRLVKGDTLPPIQPLLQEAQLTPSGMLRPNPVPLILVEGGENAMDLIRRAKGVAVRRRWWYESQRVRIDNLFII